MPEEIQTKVVFRMFNEEVIAIFPTIPADLQRNCLSYLHIGQHGSADYEYVIDSSRQATSNEYADLKAELEEIGYSPKVCLRRSPQMRKAMQELMLELMRE